MKKKTFVYYLSIKELYGEPYITDFIKDKKKQLYDQLSQQFFIEFGSDEYGFVVIPITSGIERLELLETN